MRVLFVFCMLVTATFVSAAEDTLNPHGTSIVTGQAIEVRYAGSYTYLLLKTHDGKIWAAVLRTPVWQGDTITLENTITMHNFESKPLHRTFDTILFGTLSNLSANATSTHKGVAHPVRVNIRLSGVIHVAKASGDNALTVAEINTERIEYRDKIVEVRGRVVKINYGIMGINWVHLHDGTGSTIAATNDILVTTEQEVALGEDVTAEGIVRTDVDFGSGYAYKVLIEEARFK